MALKFVELTFSKIKAEIEYYLQTEHNKHNIQFSKASPYGQILNIIEYLHQLTTLYLKNTIDQFDLNTINSVNDRIVKNAAIVAGHIPSRSISATGTLYLSMKSNADGVNGNKILLYNKTKLKNNTNGYYYSLNLGVDKMTYDVSNADYKLLLPIIQGEWKSVTRTGSGKELQTLNIVEKGMVDIDNFNVEVLVDGEYWEIKKNLYDLATDEKACVVRTGYDGGIDIIFGNSAFGKIPGISNTVTINYLKTNGSDGNIFTRTRNDFDFVDDVYDGYGDTINIGDVFNIDIYTDISFGADKESVSFTRSLLPIVSTNFVLANAEQYTYAIKKLGVFSYVNAYEEYGTVYVVATPNVQLFRNSSADYFSVGIDAFTLDNYEISKVLKYLRTCGNIQLTKKIRVSSPTLSYYAMNISVISYSDVLDDDVKSEIRAVVSDYFLNFTRVDRIPKLDIIKAISKIDDIYSVDIGFISRKNEEYHLNYQIDFDNVMANYIGDDKDSIKITDIYPDYDPTSILGLDNEMEDILFDASEIPVIRGGWKDRYGLYYDDDIDGKSQYKALNIEIVSRVDSSKRNTAKN